MRILTEPKNALVKQYTRMFEFEECTLVFEDEALRAIAHERVCAELNKLLTDSKQTPYQRVVKILFDVGDTVAQAQLMLSGLDARVTLFSEDERIPETYWNFLRLKRLDSLPQYERFLLAGETRGWGGIGPVYPTETVLRPAGNPQMLCYYQKLLAGFGECVGVIQCGVSPQKIFSSLQIEGNADVHYYVFQGGEVIYQSDAEQALPEEYRPEESRQIIRRQLYLSRPLESMGLSLVMRLDYGQLHSQALASGLVPFLTAIGSGVLLLVATCTFLWSIQKRLDQAVDFARRAKEGSMEIAFPNPGGDEVGQLIDAFNALLSRLQENSRRMIEHERNEKYAMRLALQYQMNPHFLFNSLNWIQMSTELGVEREQISEAILLLGKLLRNNLQGRAMTTLDEEARCAQDYVRLMNMRKQDLVGLDLQLNELPQNLPVMRFLFQPLCENAIQHGMETGRPLHIRIRGWQAGAQVHLVVENDGAMIPPDKLAMLRLPLGEYSKPEIRAIAEESGLVVAKKPDSQDICFVPDGDYNAFLRRWTGQELPAGQFVAEDGTVLGPNKGITHYTIGQRKGLGISLGCHAFVRRINAAENTVELTTEESRLFRRTIFADDLNWIAIEDLHGPLEVEAKIRYAHRAAAAVISPCPIPGTVRVDFMEAQRAPAPGQAVVFYRDGSVIGGGTILDMEEPIC